MCVPAKCIESFRRFCPSVFLYLSSVVPAIWLLELDKMDRRLKRMTGDDAALRPPNFKDLDKILGNQFKIKIPTIQVDTSTWITLIEQFLMLILIVGRWMLPKGDLTRDQLSQLLLVYIGTAADIIEFFDSFKDSTIANDRLLVFLTLGIWSWSLLQFTIVLSATRARKSRGGGSAVAAQYSRLELPCNGVHFGFDPSNPFPLFQQQLLQHRRVGHFLEHNPSGRSVPRLSPVDYHRLQDHHLYERVLCRQKLFGHHAADLSTGRRPWRVTEGQTT